MVDKALDSLKKQILTLLHKQQAIIARWIGTWAQYLKYEQGFDPTRLMAYKRGDILYVDFGYNIGSEQGGQRYAVVVEKNNPINSPVIGVIPISSLGQGKSRNKIHRDTVFLGAIVPDSPVESYAIPNQIRAISKLRIIRPKSVAYKINSLTPAFLTEIDKKLRGRFIDYN